MLELIIFGFLSGVAMGVGVRSYSSVPSGYAPPSFPSGNELRLISEADKAHYAALFENTYSKSQHQGLNKDDLYALILETVRLADTQ